MTRKPWKKKKNKRKKEEKRSRNIVGKLILKWKRWRKNGGIIRVRNTVERD